LAKADPLKELLRKAPRDDEILARLMALQAEPDYVLALASGALIELTLQTALLARFVPLSSTKRGRLFEDAHNGPLSTLSSKNRIAHAIGLYGQSTFNDVDKLRAIRNVFAHAKIDVTFETPALSSRSKMFELLARHYLPGTISEASGRQAFTWAVIHLHASIQSTWKRGWPGEMVSLP
jgi:hypothetical protein